MEAQKKKIILDVDTGTDDAIAIVMAALEERFDLLGVCTVSGNIEVKLTTENTLRVLTCCGKQDEIGVYKGSDLPLVSTLLPWTAQALGIRSEIDLRTGKRWPLPRREGTRLDKSEEHPEYLPLPPSETQEREESAVYWLIKTLLAQEENSVTFVQVGPATNLALALRADPRIKKAIKEIIIMGGGDRVTNTSPAAEFNTWADPEAMEIVLQSGCDILLVPLDATHSAYVTLSDAEEIAAIGTAPALLVAGLIKSLASSYINSHEEMRQYQAAPIHDALAVCAALHPQVLSEVVHCNCHVDISGGWAYGQTIVDKRKLLDSETKNCRFARNADRNFFLKWAMEVLSKDREKRPHN